MSTIAMMIPFALLTFIGTVSLLIVLEMMVLRRAWVQRNLGASQRRQGDRQ